MLRNTNKFLKYFGWLALINPLVLVKAEDFFQCSSINNFNESSCGNNASSAVSYCINSNKIYGLDASDPPACLGQISAGNHVFDTDTFTKINLATANSVTTTNLAKLALYNCDGVCKPIYGYIINSSKYYKIASDGNTEVTDEVLTCATATSDVGNLSKSGELCLGTTGPIKTSAAGDYLATFSGTNVFGAANGSYLINISSTMITLGSTITEISGTDKVYSTVAVDSIAANADVSLYICGSDNACKKTYGYVKGSTDHFSVSVSGSGKAATALASEASASAIASCTPGSIFKDGGENSKIKLCIAAGEGIELTTTATNHIISNLSNNIFTSVAASSKAKIVLQISVNAVVLNTLYDEDTSYCTYQGTNSEASLTKFCSKTVLNGKLFDCAEGLCSALTADSVANGTYLVHIDEENKIYKCASNACNLVTTASNMLVSQQKDASDIMVETMIDRTGLASLASTDFAESPTNPVYLYECASGVCKRTSGYIKYGSTAAIAECKKMTSCVEFTGVTCASGKEGKANLDNSKLTICDASAASKGYSSDDYGYFASNSLYIINSDSTIIGATTKSGNFLLGENLIICTNGECADQSSKKGYYTNTLSTTSKSLIKCDTNTKCEAVEAGNGYYFNQLDATDVIKCDNNGCSEEDKESLTQTDCSTSAYKVVSISSTFKFCKGTTATDIPSDTTVTNYFIKKALTEGMNYPTSFMATTDNNKRILIQVSQFAVTHVATSPAGYYFVDADGVLASTGTGSLLSCTGTSSPLTCEDLTTDSNAKIGYYKNAGDLNTGNFPYIACTAANTCQPKAASSDCDEIGNIFTNTDEDGNLFYSLCIDNDIKAALTSSGSYFIDVAGNDIVFGTKASSYAIITIEDENVFLKGKEGKERYRYGDANQKVIDFTNATDKTANCKDDSGKLVIKSTVQEYSLNVPADTDPTDYYTKK